MARARLTVTRSNRQILPIWKSTVLALYLIAAPGAAPGIPLRVAIHREVNKLSHNERTKADWPLTRGALFCYQKPELIRDQTELTLSPEMAYPCLSNLQSVSPVWSRITLVTNYPSGHELPSRSRITPCLAPSRLVDTSTKTPTPCEGNFGRLRAFVPPTLSKWTKCPSHRTALRSSKP
jgi:hypothetical protein